MPKHKVGDIVEMKFDACPENYHLGVITTLYKWNKANLYDCCLDVLLLTDHEAIGYKVGGNYMFRQKELRDTDFDDRVKRFFKLCLN